MNTYQDYFFGLTADSDTRFKIDMSQSSPFEGRTARKGGEPTEIMLKCDPQGSDGIYVAHLCFILPEEPTFSKFYKITCTAGEATRDSEADLPWSPLSQSLGPPSPENQWTVAEEREKGFVSRNRLLKDRETPRFKDMPALLSRLTFGSIDMDAERPLMFVQEDADAGFDFERWRC